MKVGKNRKAEDKAAQEGVDLRLVMLALIKHEFLHVSKQTISIDKD